MSDASLKSSNHRAVDDHEAGNFRETCLGNYFWHCGASFIPGLMPHNTIHAETSERKTAEKGRKIINIFYDLAERKRQRAFRFG